MNAFIQIFTDPRAVFDAQRDDSSWLIPALVILAFMILAGLAIALTVYTEAQLEAMIEQMEESGSPQAEIDKVRTQAELVRTVGANPIVSIGVSLLGISVAFALVVLAHAVYYLIIGKILKTEYEFADWLAFSVWGRMPAIVGAVVIILAVLLMSQQLNATAYNLLAFSNWVTLPNQDSLVLGQFVQTLDLIVIWTIAIMTIGYNSWTEKGYGVSFAVVALPYVAIYGAVMAY